MGFLKKIGKGISKAWDSIDEYAVPVLVGGVLGAATGGLGAWAATGLLSEAAAAGISIGGAAAAGGVSGAVGGFSQGHAAVTAQKAAEDAERAAERQEIMAKAAPTQTASPEAIISQAQQSVAGESSMQKRRYSTSKTTNSRMGLSRLASGSNTGRKTLA